MLSIEEIKEIIPHRYPFLLIDRVTELQAGESCTAIKNVSANEEFFNGHFPDFPLMPGVLIVEALAQTGAVALLKHENFAGKLAVFAGIDNCRFKGQVKPGDQLKLETTLTRVRGSIGKGHGVASVDGQTVAELDLMFAITDKDS
ncbi:(3R)-hydroxymyristoyl-[acyl carrier protein] dehydratase [Geomicrobium sp. JCM 19037]|uniref:3-hydroxyacyl-ACP dehydratase FabZ n=1 Tax=unclassified Geomicrobium TaxID=2628951 RepID=UPI00045F2698|nr:3-hydroxyacyl-ACP dehydratase FabZ [Geomicrobium sp. JCM 19037]GAK05065.1 (3R)-hydroxymyristoyl-[acyl carrier protein] dehydratase [Geomicrobium sp. JCM 19037]